MKKNKEHLNKVIDYLIHNKQSVKQALKQNKRLQLLVRETVTKYYENENEHVKLS